MQHKNYLLLISFWVGLIGAFSLMCSSLVYAAQWQPRIYDYGLPQRVVAIDKNKQKFYLYEKKSPLKLKLSYPCTTGQATGDKQVANDLRTPEGVYFIEYKIAKGLDFKEYGGIAYTLNYPNPVDKLRGKTGYGIWIHSKGEDKDIIPLNTRGCIAIERKNILEVGPMLLPGTAVVVGESLNESQVPMQDTGISRHLRLRMEQWTRAWASRSHKFFEFYDANSYTKGMPESFNAFKANKQRLFKLLAWINIFNREVHVLEGPGYWVTWSEQFYRAPNLSTEGVRRLYWQRDTDGQFRIVGMEWIPRNVGMQAAFEKGQLVAQLSNTTSDALSPDVQGEMPTPPPLSMPEVDGDNTQSLAAESSEELKLNPELKQEIQQNLDARMKAWKARKAQDFYAFYDVAKYGRIKNAPKSDFTGLKQGMSRYFNAAWIDILSNKAQVQIQDDNILTTTKKFIYLPNGQKVEGEEILYWQLDNKNKWRVVASKWIDKKLGLEAAYLESISSSVAKFVVDWRNDWLDADIKAYMNYYAPNAKQGARSKAGIAAQKKALWATAAPEKIQLNGLRVQLDAKGVRADMTQVYSDENGKGDKGTKTLILEPHNGSWRIIVEAWNALQQSNAQ